MSADGLSPEPEVQRLCPRSEDLLSDEDVSEDSGTAFLVFSELDLLCLNKNCFLSVSLLTAQLEALGLKRAEASVLLLSGCHHFTLRRHDRQQLAGLHRRLQQIHHRVRNRFKPSGVIMVVTARMMMMMICFPGGPRSTSCVGGSSRRSCGSTCSWRSS